MRSLPGRLLVKNPREHGGSGCPTKSASPPGERRTGQGWLRAQLAACSLPGFPAASGMCWAPPAWQWGFTDMVQVAEAQTACGYPVQTLLPLGKAICLSSTAEGSSARLDVRSRFACRGQEGEQDLTWSSEVVVTPRNAFTDQHLHSAACSLGRSRRRQGGCFPDQGTVSKRTAVSHPRHCRQDTLWWTEGARAQGSASQTPAGTARCPRASLIEVSGLVGDGLEVLGE